MVSDILINSQEETDESLAGEETVYHIEEANKEVAKHGANVVVVSEDADC